MPFRKTRCKKTNTDRFVKSLKTNFIQLFVVLFSARCLRSVQQTLLSTSNRLAGVSPTQNQAPIYLREDIKEEKRLLLLLLTYNVPIAKSIK